MNIYEKLVDLFVGILVMILFPVLYVAKKTAVLSYEALSSETREFVDDVTNHQAITAERMDSFQSQISSKHEAVLVTMAIDQFVYEPIDPENPGEIYSYHEIICDREIKEKLYEGDGKVLIPTGSYFEVTLVFPNDTKKVIHCGGAIR